MNRSIHAAKVCDRGPRALRPGFTLVELLVVITIIGMLTGLLLPAVNAARETGRRATCINNQHQLATAMLGFDSARRYFPGYCNQIAANVNASWVVALFPYMEQKDLYDLWTSPANWINNTPPALNIRILTCPSDPPPTNSAGDTWLSYVCNRGVNHRFNAFTGAGAFVTSNNSNDDNATGTASPASTNPGCSGAQGVCMDLANPKALLNTNPDWQTPLPGAYGWVKVGTDFISAHDGTTNTLLLSESVLTDPGSQPMYLREYPGATLGSGASGERTYRPNPKWNTLWNSGEAQINLSFEWGPAPSSAGNDGWPPSTWTTRTALLSDKIRSRHPGGVVATFCDGHQQFLRDTTDVNVFKQLMTPWGAGCPGANGTTSPDSTNTVNGNRNPLTSNVLILDEATF